MLRRITWLVGVVAAGVMGGCDASAVDVDEPHAVTVSERNADIGTWGFYQVSYAEDVQCFRPPCEQPIFIKQVNRDVTTCLDGTENNECLVRDIEFVATEIGQPQQEKFREIFTRGYGIAEGWLELVPQRGVGPVETLFIAGPWLGAVPEPPMAPMFQVTPADIMCVRAPCPTHYAQVVNKPTVELVDQIDLGASEVDDSVAAQGYSELKKGALLISGEIWRVGDPEQRSSREPLPGSKVLSAENFFIRFD